MNAPHPIAPEHLADDLVWTAAGIAVILFGDARQRRTIYSLVKTSRIPVKRLGGRLVARKSELVRWASAEMA